MKKLISLTIAALIALTCFSATAAVVPYPDNPEIEQTTAPEIIDPSDIGEETTAPEIIDPSDIGEETTAPEIIDPSDIGEETTETETTEPEKEPETTQATSATEPKEQTPAKPSESDNKKSTVQPATYKPVWNQYHNRICGKKWSDGKITFVMSAKGKDKAKQTGNDLQYLLSGNKKKTIVLPKSKITIQRVLMPGNNTTLIASGATIFQNSKKKPLLTSYSNPKGTVYKPAKNVKVVGGKWRLNGNKTNKRPTSTVRYLNSSKITLKNLDIETNYRSHGIELLGCKNVTIDGCKVLAIGKTVKVNKKKGTGLDEAIQIDISSKSTTSGIPAKYLKGQVCSNITIKNTTARGGRGVCANYTKGENYKWVKKHHTNITVIGCNITGMTAEGLALHNTAGIKVDKNTIISKSKLTSDTYSIGLNIASFGKSKDVSKKSISVTNNTIKGGRQAIQAVTYNPKKSGTYGKHKLGTVTIKNNKLYCKKGKKNCILTKKCKKVKKSKNKCYKW